ncbi:MAG: hypothetical protein JWL59_302 [Chthoniobacteraceae bacterium]|nr:hypothetical protein [Chthoniobacteraceae bacterium]
MKINALGEMKNSLLKSINFELEFNQRDKKSITQLAGRRQLDTRRRGDAGKMFVPSGKTSTFSSADCPRWKPFGKNFLETNFLGCRARFIASGWPGKMSHSTKA